MPAFKAELQTANWDDVTGDSDTNIIASYNECFPLKKGKGKKRLFEQALVVQALSP